MEELTLETLRTTLLDYMDWFEQQDEEPTIIKMHDMVNELIRDIEAKKIAEKEKYVKSIEYMEQHISPSTLEEWRVARDEKEKELVEGI